MMDECDDQKFLDLVRGEGKFAYMGVGLHTYPDSNPANQSLHAGLEKLEQEGLIKRQINEPGHVYWVAVREQG